MNVTQPTLSDIEWEVLAFAAKPNRKYGAFDIFSEISRHRKASRIEAIRRLQRLDLLNVMPGRGFGTITEDGRRALAERKGKAK